MRSLSLLLLPLSLLAQQTAADSARTRPIAQAGLSPELAMGKRLFDISCARCHGIDGGGDLGPPLTRSELRLAPNDSALRSIIQNGIEGTSMPRLFYITNSEAKLISAYVRSLGRVPTEPLRGSAANGRVAYQRFGCNACHTISGFGGVAGPELTDIGSRRSATHLRRSITDPEASLTAKDGVVQYLMTRVETRDGRSVQGVRLNEDGFSIQIRDVNGRMHSFRKTELRKLEKDFKSSLMPSYRAQLSVQELDDIVAYLATRRVGGAK